MCTSVHVCVSVCTVCARVSVSVVHGVHGVQNVVGPDGGFQRVFCEVCATFAECVGLCRRTRRASESV